MVLLSSQTADGNSRFRDMQELTLPPVNNKIYLSTVSTKQPPGRSWSRYKKLLIDTPKDSNLLQRQKLWNFQKLNRGAFRSQIASLPDIPYRVHTNTVDKVSVGVQAGPYQRFNSNLRVIFPNLTSGAFRFLRDENSDDDDDDDDDDGGYDGETAETKDKACSPMHLDESDEYSNDFESDLDDPYYEFDSVIRKKDAGTMTDVKKNMTKHNKKKERKKRTLKDRHSKREQRSILINTGKSKRSNSAHRNVKFKDINVIDEATQTPDIPDVTPPIIERIEIETIRPIDKDTVLPTPEPSPLPAVLSPPVPRLESLQSESADFLNAPFETGHIGHSSHRSLESLSVLDYLSGARTDRSRNIDSRRQLNSDRQKDGHSKLDVDADRQWFQQIVGDKHIVDLSGYENFARVRPNLDSQSDSNTDRYTDLGKAAVSKRGGYTPRINGEPPVSKTQQYLSGLAAKQEAALAATNVKNKPTKRTMINIGKSY